MHRDWMNALSDRNSKRIGIQGDVTVPDDRTALWIRCSQCGAKTRTMVYENTVLLNFPLFCPKCKRENKVNVIKLKMVESKEPDV